VRFSSRRTALWISNVVLAATALAVLATIARADDLTSSAPVAHAETAAQLLERMGDAVRTRNYQGTIVYAHDGTLEVMQLVHAATADGERGRLTTVSGAKREVISERDELRLFLPDQRTVLVERGIGGRGRGTLPKMLPADITSFAANYRIADLGLSNEAGRGCRRVGITPLDALRYGYQLCLDLLTALPLRTELRSEDGKRIIEQVVFSQIDFPERIAESALKPTSGGSDWTTVVQDNAAASAADDAHWTVARLPEGFVAAPTNDVEASGAPAATHLAFSDGLAAVSVFIEPRGDDGKGLEGAARMGAMNLYGRIVDDHQVTVVGEVPAATVRLIAQSVAAKRPER
jgi:sigma-E factor negative regulatory protein RseB